jgi:hypothetical protein
MACPQHAPEPQEVRQSRIGIKGRRFLAQRKEPLIAAGASGLYSTPDDSLRWLSWRPSIALGRKTPRSGSSTMLLVWSATVSMPSRVFDESGQIDVISLGWIVRRTFWEIAK